MGTAFSINDSGAGPSEPFEVSRSEGCKKQMMASGSQAEELRLIPGLPHEISLHILARVPRINYLKLKGVSRAWKFAITSADLFNLRKALKRTEEWLYVLTNTYHNRGLWYALDPLAATWLRLPTMPRISFEEASRRRLHGIRIWNMVDSSMKIVDAIKGWLGRKDGDDGAQCCGCAIGAVNGSLYVLGGFSRALSVKCVWQYDPILNEWREASPMISGRAYCKTGILNDKIYVVGGVMRERGGLAPLKSGEVYNPQTGLWSEIPNMPFLRAQELPTAFLTDLLKPVATGMTSHKGKLLVSQNVYCWPFFVDVGGEVYDPDVGKWVEMPLGMGNGWPARQGGTKVSVTVDGELYALDPSTSFRSAKIKVYDYQNDSWKVVDGDVPIHDSSDSDTPYLLASLLGKLHVIRKDDDMNITLLQYGIENRLDTFLENSSYLLDGLAQPPRPPEIEQWKLIASRTSRSVQLLSCQTLNI